MKNAEKLAKVEKIREEIRKRENRKKKIQFVSKCVLTGLGTIIIIIGLVIATFSIDWR